MAIKLAATYLDKVMLSAAQQRTVDAQHEPKWIRAMTASGTCGHIQKSMTYAM
jgi:hypothetical protein